MDASTVRLTPTVRSPVDALTPVLMLQPRQQCVRHTERNADRASRFPKARCWLVLMPVDWSYDALLTTFTPTTTEHTERQSLKVTYTPLTNKQQGFPQGMRPNDSSMRSFTEEAMSWLETLLVEEDEKENESRKPSSARPQPWLAC